jgi:hypothetical protein
MKVLVSTGGAFILKEEYWKEFYEREYNVNRLRTDEKLIRLAESGVELGDEGCTIHVVELPDDISDYTFEMNMAGSEYVIFVQDGKIHYA